MIREAIALSEELDLEFLAAARNCNSFNLPNGAFESTEKKQEIRNLISTAWFDGAHLETHATFDKDSYQSAVNQIRNLNAKSFLKLYFYDKTGIGPGEILTYIIFDDVSLGGGKSAGLDIVSSNGGFEMKSVQPSFKAGDIYGKGVFVSNFKLGGTISLGKIMVELEDLKKEATKIDKKMGKAKEVGLTHYAFFAEHFPTRWKKVLSAYQTAAFGYFKGHELFCTTNKASGNFRVGDVLLLGKVTKKQILMGNMTSGTVKPILRISK